MWRSKHRATLAQVTYINLNVLLIKKNSVAFEFSSNVLYLVLINPVWALFPLRCS